MKIGNNTEKYREREGEREKKIREKYTYKQTY